MRFNLRILRLLLIAGVSLLISGVATATTTPHSTKSSSNSHKSSKSSKSSKSAKTTSGKSTKKKKSGKSTARGQRGIDQARTEQIQEALIREHYLTGEPTGNWDQSTKDALTRFQGTNGWQTKSVPDSRALIKLGLGPDKSGLLNPDTAVMMSPHELGTPRDVHPGGASQQ